MMKLIEHYHKWHIVYGIVGLFNVIAMVTFANEAVRKAILNAWKVAHSLGWFVAIMLWLLFTVSAMAAVKALYTLIYRPKKKYGLEDDDETNK